MDAAREIATVPVIGIAGSAFQLASLVSYRFGNLTTMTRTLPSSEHLLQRYGYQHLCSGARATDIAVLGLEDTSDKIYLEIKQEYEKSIRIDGAEAIVLGCAGTLDLGERLPEDQQVPVIDGLSVTVKLAWSLHQLGLITSKVGHMVNLLRKQFLVVINIGITVQKIDNTKIKLN